MPEVERSKAELKARIRTLEAALAQQKRATQQAQAEADQLWHALQAHPHTSFTIEVDTSGEIEHIHSQKGPCAEVDLHDLLAGRAGARQCQRALEAARPTTFETSCSAGGTPEMWSVVLAPDPASTASSDSASCAPACERRLRGVACQTPLRAEKNGAPSSKKADLFDRAFHLGPAALMIARLDDGVVLDASQRLLGITGYTAEEFIGASLVDLGLWVDPNERKYLVEQLLDARTIQDREFQIRRKDGSIRTVLGSAHCVELDGHCCLMGSIIDITRRKQAAAAERESRALLRKIFHASPAPIFISRLRDGQFLNVNAAMCQLVDAEADELLGRCCSEVNIWEEPDLSAVLDDQLRLEAGTYDGEVVLRTQSGERVTVLASCQRIQVEGEACALTVMTDITARKKTEEALIRAKEQAEEIAQFRSALFTNLTHEVRTPLTVILGFTSILEKGVCEEYQRFIRLIERSGQRLMFTLDSLLDLAQLEAGTLEVHCEVYDVTDVVHGIAETMETRAARKGLDFVLDLPAAQALASIDYELFTRALSHLIDNAVKFTEEGTVTVAIELDDDWIRVQVRDTGVGIDMAFVERAFDAFSQESDGLNRTHQGSGLGLTVAKRLIDQLDGDICVDTERGQGSVFTITLPRLTPEGAHAAIERRG